MTACSACDGKGVVPSATGDQRPCSRCRADDFSRWYENERDCHAAQKAVTDFEKNGGATLEDLRKELDM